MYLKSSGNKTHLNKGLPLYATLTAAGIIGFILAYIPVQCGDALSYAFIFPDDYYADFEGRIASLSDIFHSQINHWKTVNGRFPVHVIVQIFCGLLPQWVFALLNGCVWSILFYILICFSGINQKSDVSLSVALLIYCCVLFPLSCDIPVQVNYIWTAAIVFGWIYQFLYHPRPSRHEKVHCIIFFMWGIVAGACHEGFSIPLCITLISCLLSLKSDISSKQFLGTAGVIIGTFFLVVSPGNFIRFNEVEISNFSILIGIEQTIPALILPLLIIILCIINRQTRKIFRNDTKTVFLVIMALACGIMSLLMKFKFGVRGIFPGSLILGIILLTILKHFQFHFNRIIIGLSWLFVIAFLIIKVYGIAEENRIYRIIEQQYKSSESGTVFLSDNDFLKAMPLAKVRAHALELTAHSFDSTATTIKLLPYSFKSLNPEKNKNIIYEFRPQAWILIQSKENPANFTIEKTLLPGILNRKCSPRTIDFNDIYDIAVDTTGQFRIAVYHNRRPYLKSAIKKEDKTAYQ